jgi:hypothetical protein
MIMCDNASCATKTVTLQKRRISALQDVNNAYKGVTEYVSRFCSICFALPFISRMSTSE